MPASENNDSVEVAPGFLNGLSRKNRGLFFWLTALALVFFAGWVIYFTKSSAKEGGHHDLVKASPVPVSIATAVTRNFPIYLDGLGTVQAYNTVEVTARVSGLIQAIKFSEGQDVKEGDLLAVIDPTTYQAQYDQALSKQVQDEAQLQSAKAVLERDQQLLDKAVLDKQSYDTQKYLVAQMQGAVQADAANVQAQKSQLDWTRVTAPISGKTGIRLIDVGNQVSLGGNNPNSLSNAIVTINQIQPIYVAFTLPQQDLEQIREPMMDHRELPVIAMDRNNQKPLSRGVLSVIDNQIDTATATVKLKATFTNDDDRLWPGQFVNVRLLVREQTNAVVVPSVAVQLGPDGSYVYVVGGDSRVSMRTVETGPTEDGMMLIESGLSPGETVVTDGQYRLQPDTQVSVASKSLAIPANPSAKKTP
jgi:multidrug efflux system membrane fusion protein